MVEHAGVIDKWLQQVSAFGAGAGQDKRTGQVHCGGAQSNPGRLETNHHCNQANYELAKDVIKFIETRGVPILNITLSEFDTYKKSKHLLILGGPNETGRLGEIAREMLSKEERDWASQVGNKKMYLKMDKWREEQYILVFAGYDGNATYRALINNKDKWWVYISSWFDIELSHEEIYGY